MKAPIYRFAWEDACGRIRQVYHQSWRKARALREAHRLDGHDVGAIEWVRMRKMGKLGLLVAALNGECDSLIDRVEPMVAGRNKREAIRVHRRRVAV